MELISTAESLAAEEIRGIRVDALRYEYYTTLTDIINMRNSTV